MAFKNALGQKSRPVGRGEVHFFGDDREKRIEFIDSFPFPKREPDEKLIDFKERVTGIVELSCQCTAGREIITVKWIGPLGYHQGYVDPR